MKIAIVNGPNLNKIGQREPHIYGKESFEHFFEGLQKSYPKIEFQHFQSNHASELIDALHGFDNVCDGIILNAGAFTHTSLALADAVAGLQTTAVEVHLSNTLARENFRHHSHLTMYVKGCVQGFGLESYRLAVASFL